MLLKLDHLKKSFNNRNILKDVNFKINKGELVALIGKNGAGKTTLVNCILGLENKDEGSINKYYYEKKDVGFMPQDDIIPDTFTVFEALQLQKKVYKVDVNIKKILKEVNLLEKKNTIIKRISGGQKRKLSFLNAIIHNPKFIILDEPTTGLDLDAIEIFWNIVGKLKKQKHSILLITHDFDQIQNYADRVLILKDGRINDNFEINRLDNKYVYELIITKFNNQLKNLSNIQNVLSQYKNLKFYIDSYKDAIIVSELDNEKIINILNELDIFIDSKKRPLTLKDVYKFNDKVKIGE